MFITIYLIDRVILRLEVAFHKIQFQNTAYRIKMVYENKLYVV